MNELERAVSAAHTYLQRNPEDPVLSRSLNYYKSLLDTEEYLVDHEEKPYEVFILSNCVFLFNLICERHSSEITKYGFISICLLGFIPEGCKAV